MPGPVHGIQGSFAGGEFSPSLYARVDIAKYNTGLRTARNVMVLPQGGIRNRPGTKMVATAGDSSKQVRLIPFIASTTQAFVIELGDFYARFYTADAQVQVSAPSAWVTSTYYVVGNYVVSGGTNYYCLVAHTSGTFATDLAAGKWITRSLYQIPTPWAASDLFKLKFAQSANTLFVAHPTYAPQIITNVSSASWRLAPYSFLNGPFQVRNTDSANTVTPSATGTPKSPTFQIIESIKSASAGLQIHSSNTMTLSNNDIVTFSGVTVYPQLNGQSFRITNVTISGLGATTFNLLNLSDSSPFIPSGWPAAGSQSLKGWLVATTPITLTALSAIFSANQIGSLFQMVQTLAAQTLTDAGFTANTYASNAIACGSTWSLITFGGWTGKIAIQGSTDNGATWSAIQTLQSTGSSNFQVSGQTGFSQGLIRVAADSTVAWAGTLTIDLTANSFDWVTSLIISGYTSTTVVVGVPICQAGIGVGLASTAPTSEWSLASWSIPAGYPTCVSFFQDRLAWASTITEPTTGWLTQVSAYSDFGISSPLVASDAFSFLVPSRQLNAIQNLVVMPQAMVALTSDSEWSIAPDSSGVFSATSFSISLNGHRGSSAIDPAVVGIEMLMIQQMGTVVRNFIFQLAVQGFFGDNISIVSQHLFTGYTIAEMAYAQEPDSIVYFVRSDGQLLTLTYLREQEMMAWTHHDTLGSYESVCVIPNLTLGINEVWTVVNRTIGGATKRFIERFVARDQGAVVSNQFFVDCGLTYSGAAATAITGLDHLEGQTVAILADGNVVPNQVVSGGQITLDVAASIVQVGLPYVSDVETLKIELPGNIGTQQGRRLAVAEVTMRFWNSRGGYLAAISDDSPAIASSGVAGMDEIFQRGPGNNLDAAIPLKTYDYRHTLNGGYDYGGRIMYRQVDPLPFTILAFIPRLIAGDT